MKEQLKKNKLLFVLPLVLLPFVVLIFYVLDGGTQAKENEKRADNQNNSGANYIIPEADQSIEIFDKLEAYQQQGIGEETEALEIVDTIRQPMDTSNSSVTQLPLLAEQNQHLPEDLLEHIKQKEKEVQAELNEDPLPKTKPKVKGKSIRQKQKPVAEEPKISSTGIEELDLVFEQNKALSRRNDSLHISLQQAQQQLQLIEANKNIGFEVKKQATSGFERMDKSGSLIKAEIYESATVLNGTRVKLRMLEDVLVNGESFKRNTFFYGTCIIKNERLLISVDQLPIGNDFIPVKLTIHDLDGIEGLYVPDNVARKVYQEVGSATNTSSLMGVTNDPLSYAGIRAADRTAQTLLKRIRLKKVSVKKNTLVYLINQN